MTRLNIYLAAGAAGLAAVAAAVPATAQVPYQSPYAYPQANPQSYPQPAPGQPGYNPQAGYGQPVYGYNPQGYAYPQQGYAYPQQGQGGISDMINQLLGNRYQANDRYAVQRCATAAMAQANAQYRPNQYRQDYRYQNQGYYPATSMRVTAITEVRRRNNGVRVSGMLDSRGGYGQPYGNAYGYQGQRYAGQGDLTFRCNVDYRGAVSNVRINRNRAAYNRGY
ncbi:MAG TPA: hypothetical protein VFO09_06145 [Methyloceanibacter sp.]|nr:hypothetical protein [Methyloceanibacter sp.]